jgi:hypothetical protein
VKTSRLSNPLDFQPLLDWGFLLKVAGSSMDLRICWSSLEPPSNLNVQDSIQGRKSKQKFLVTGSLRKSWISRGFSHQFQSILPRFFLDSLKQSPVKKF